MYSEKKERKKPNKPPSLCNVGHGIQRFSREGFGTQPRSDSISCGVLFIPLRDCGINSTPLCGCVYHRARRRAGL